MSTYPECSVFEEGSRKWKICRNESNLPVEKINAYRIKWGLAPLDLETTSKVKVDASPELVFHGVSVSSPHVKAANTPYGPGTELLAIYHAAGVPTCELCKELAQKMNNWGVVECRKRIDYITSDILPRAMEWLAENYPWASRLIPNAISELAVVTKIKMDVESAIVTAERTMGERRAKRLNPYTGEKVSGCSSCGKSKQTNKTSPIRIYGSQTPKTFPPLIGQPINRERLTSHIMYHIMPLAGDTEWVWRRHCQWLRDIRPQFNGRLIVGIVTPGEGDAWEYHHPDVVKEELRGLDAEFITAPNDTGRGKHRKRVRQGIGEGVLFPLMLEQLQTNDPDQVAFYGHCKGVTRPNTAITSAIHLWAEAMFETLFRNHDAAIAALDNHGVCGPFRMKGGYRDGGPGIGSKWFFSGTFFATRLVDAFARNWKYIPKHYGCVEQWPRLNFEQHEQAACLFFDNCVNLYDESYWRSTVMPAFNHWKAEHGTRRSV